MYSIYSEPSTDGGGGKLDVIHFNKFNEIEIIDCGALYKYY